jgi:hypothetical protein
MSNKIVDISGLERFFDNIKNYISGILSNKVDKVQGKDLSTEDFTTELKSKLSQVNILAEDAKTVIDDINKDTYIKYVVQSLTTEEKRQARKNIEAISINELPEYKDTFKTVNGNTIFGNGDIITRKEIIKSSGSDVTVLPNIYQKHQTITSELYFHLMDLTTTQDYLNEYFIEFTTHPNGTSVTLSEDIKWVNGEIPVFENDCTYQISIINNLGVCVKFT